MALVAPPVNVGLTLKIAPDGSLTPTGELGIAGPAGLGTGVVCVTNMGGDATQSSAVTIQYL